MATFRSTRFRGRRWRETLSFYLFVGPWILGFVVLGLFPLVLGFLTSFTNYNGFNLGHLVFVGLLNYAHAFTSIEISHALGRTVIFTVVNVPLGIVIGVLLAVILNQAIPARGVFRTLFYLPTVIPIVATVWIWELFLDANYGLVNAVISMVAPNILIKWLVDYPTWVLIALTLWTSVGSGMIIFLAGLQGVPNELKEAAKIDGAGTWQVFQSVTLPLLTPVIFFELILGIIGSLQVLVAPLLLAGATLSSIPPPQNYFYLVEVYEQVFAHQNFGYGTALLWLLFVVIIVFSMLVFRSARYWVYYEVDQEGAR
ncbi:MAG TPA: sugar ABC transporter permease [Chloroflexota bacterium]|nr:sugar ABC transporter permease [Chloroflexota bacterium]